MAKHIPRRHLFGLAAGAALAHAAPGTAVAGFVDGVAAKGIARAELNASRSFLAEGLREVLHSLQMQMAFHPVYSRLSYKLPQLGPTSQFQSAIAHACTDVLNPYAVRQVLFSREAYEGALHSHDIEYHLNRLSKPQVTLGPVI